MPNIFISIGFLNFIVYCLGISSRFFFYPYERPDHTFVFPEWLGLIVMLATVIIFYQIYAFFIELLRRHMMKRLENLLDEQCNTTQSLARYQQIAKRTYRDYIYFYASVHIANCYIYRGQYDLAWERLNEAITKNAPERKFRLHFLSQYYITLVTYHIETGNLSDARQSLEQLNVLLKEKRPAKLNLDIYDLLMAEKRLLLRIKEGNLEGATEGIKDFLAGARSTFHIVMLNYQLAQVLLQQNQPEQAKEAYQYVADHGGDTYYATKAREYLTGPEESK